MKIYLDNCDLAGSRTGPNTFAKRLAIGLSKRGHIIADPSDYDIAIVFIEKTQNLNSKKPYVHRLDGMWMKHEQHASGMNDSIKRTMEDANAVIYQSNFDKQMLSKWLVQKESVVIKNGIEIQKLETVSSDILRLRSEFEKIFVCSANWHPQKRLKANIDLFKTIQERQYPNSCLLVLGNHPDFLVADKHIFYAGSWPQEMCLQVFSIADWMIHLAYLDHCPNTCVESISQGCPVICSNEGGTKELVHPYNGIIVQEQKQFDFELNDYDNPPILSFDNVESLPENLRADPSSVDIEKTIIEYEKVLKNCLDGM